MDLHFKIEQAHEEITWLNVEICRVATYIHDEDHFLTSKVLGNANTHD